MIGYITLLLSLVILWIFVYYYTQKDVFKPVSVIIFLQIISTLSAILGKSSWNYNTHDLTITTYLIVIFSSIAIIIGDSLASKNYLFKKTLHTNFNKKIIEEDYYYDISMRYYYILLIIELILFYIYFHFLTITFGTNDIALLIYYGHEWYFWPSLVQNETAQTIARYIFRLIKVIGYAFIVVFSYNFLIECKKKFLMFIPIIIYLFVWVLSGSRHNTMLTLIAVGLLIYINALKYNRINIKRIRKLLLPIALAAAFFVVVFFLGASSLWATNNENALSYVSFTFGCSIPTMNEALISEQGFDINQPWGVTTFSGFYKLFEKLGIISEYVKSSKGWIIFEDPSGVSFASNTFSAPYNLFYDFGFIGMFIFCIIEGFFYSKIYIRAMKASKTDYLAMVIFAYFITSMFNWFRTEDLFAANLIELSTYVSIPLTILVIKLFFKRKTYKAFNNN